LNKHNEDDSPQSYTSGTDPYVLLLVELRNMCK